MGFRRIMRISGCAAALLAIFLASLSAFAVSWVFDTWANLQMDELIFTLSTMTGAGGDMVTKFIVSCLIPAAVVLVLSALLMVFVIIKHRAQLRSLFNYLMLASLAVFTASVGIFLLKMDVVGYVQTMSTPSDYIENNYVDPSEVDLKFPEEKRNLIYIFLESTETTFADKASGGAFNENVIPELTRIAMENEDFSGNSAEINGARVMSGCSWTIAAMFAQTSGLPLKISVGQNDMRYQDSFFSGVTTLGDILAAEGYNQTLLIGSDSEFGGRELYFTEHGNYKICDYFYAAENGHIPENYYVWWGYEDYYLFENAKREINELAAQDAPFNFTMLTVDTHFEDGHICPYCTDQFADRYSNVYACASCQVSAFLDWIEQQPFYENTTVVITGDHLTMDSDYCADISSSYNRKVFTSFINSPVSPRKAYSRKFSTFDMFPTTLASLGVKIPGERLGLGTNLYSPIVTLLERDGFTAMNVELEKRSEFMEELGAVEIYASADVNIDYLNETDSIAITVSGIENAGGSIAEMILTLEGDDGVSHEFTLEKAKKGVYTAEIDVSFLPDRRATAQLYASDGSGTRYILDSFYGDLALARRADFDEYLSEVSNLDHHTVIFAAQDDASRKFAESSKAIMRTMGLENLDLYYPNSYIAVLSGGKVLHEEVSDEGALSHTATLGDGSILTVRSAAFCYGNSCSISINGEEYAPGTTGMNIVVYDDLSHTVVSSRVYNLSSGVPTVSGISKFALGTAEVALEFLPETESLVITVTGISGVEGGIKTVNAELWSGAGEKVFVTLDGRFGAYSAAADVSAFYGGDISVNINAITSNTQYRLTYINGELADWINAGGR